MKLFPAVLITLTTFSFFGCTKQDNNQPPIANAGESAAIWLPTNTVTLTGFGTDADGSVVGYSWSQVDGPQQSQILTPNQASTHIGNLGEGTYIFKLMVTDNNGAMGADTVSVTVNPSLTDTLVLQPDQNPNEVVIAGNIFGYDVSNPNWIEILATAWTSGGEFFQGRNAFGFDLSNIPANATIERATLSLYSNPNPQNGDLIHANYGPDNAMLIQRITTPWQAHNVNWVNQPSSTSEDQIVIASTTLSFLDLTDIDVTKLVTKMIDQNYGFLIRLQTEQMYNSRIFCSSRHADATKHPKLVIIYKK